MFLESNRNL